MKVGKTLFGTRNQNSMGTGEDNRVNKVQVYNTPEQKCHET